jgi:hypothetical protein
MVKYQGPRFVIERPASWQTTSDATSGAVTMAPQGGASAAGLSYGAMIAIEKQSGNGITDAASLSAATMALAQRLSQQNGGLELVGQMNATTVGGQQANVVELRGTSPVVENGRHLPERDRLLAVARSDGDLSYVVFVCPESDLNLLKPVFDAMSASFQAQ